MIKTLPEFKQAGSVLVVTLLVVFLITMVVTSIMGGIDQEEAITRNNQFRLTVMTAASSEIGAQIRDVNQNGAEDDDTVILNLLSTVGVNNDYELPLGSRGNPIKTAEPPHVELGSASISANRSTAIPCLGESLGKANVLAGVLQVSAEMADTGIQSTQRQHFLYCWN